MPGYNPESILEENFESQRKQIQKQFQFQWDDINRQARDNLFKSPKEHEAALHDLYTQNKQIMLKFDQQTKQATGQLQQINRLAEQGAIQNPDEVKWRLVMGPEAEKAMFPQQRDPRDEYRKIITTENIVLQRAQEFVRGRDGKLYRAKVDADNYYTKDPDKSKPATQREMSTWAANLQALDQLEQQKIEALEELTGMGIPDPYRLQSLMQTKEKEGFFKKWGRETAFRMRGGTKEELMRMREPVSTFAQKVQEDIVSPQRRQPRVRKPPRQELLAEYRRLGGSNTPEGRTFADRNLR